jgi:leucyl-tRNA synthetase
MEWDESSVEGQYRFLARVYRFVTRNTARESDGATADGDREALRKVHQTIRKITNDFDSRWHFNTSIASLMQLVNELYGLEPKLSARTAREICEKLALMLAPFAPYTAQDLWEALGHDGAIFRESWPVFDPELAKEDLLEIPVQVNGKLRGHIHAPLGAAKEYLEQRAMENEKVRAFLEGKRIVKVVVVAEKLVNIVAK